MTPHEKLMWQAAKAAMRDKGPLHPTLGTKRFGEMTYEELNEIIA